MKIEEKLKVILVVLIVILISLVSFGGFFVSKMKFVENIIPEYQLGMDLKGSRSIGLEVSTAKNTVIYDKDGNVVEKEGKDTVKKEEPVNSQDSLNIENYKKTKSIIEKRLNAMKVEDYTIRMDDTTGKVYVQLPENANTDLYAQYIAIKGVFTVVNDNGDVLLNNSHIKKAQVGYNTTSTGTTVYLTIQLNKEGTQIFKDITNTYVTSTDDEGKDTSKKITLKIDDSTLLNTSFDSEITTGTIQMSIGSSSTDSSTIQGYVKEASNITVLLNNGELPLTYNIKDNRYVISDITANMFYIPVIVISIIFVIGLIFLIIKYRKNGALSSIAFVGYVATLLLVLRYANVVLTMEGIVAIIISAILNYIFTMYLLNILKQKETKTFAETLNTFKQALLKTLLILVPVVIVAITLCFAGWLPIYSFGMVMFWGLLLIVLYNLVITRTLILDTNKK